MRLTCTTAALGAAACLVTGCSTPPPREAPRAQPVRTERVVATPDVPAVRYSASIEPFEQVPLAFKASGYVDDVLRRPGPDGRLRVAQPGDRVTRGTVLARVRETEYRERINEGQAKVAEGDASLAKARLDLDRARALFDAESLTKPDLDSAQAAFDSAMARVEAARAEVALARSALEDCALTAPADGVILERRIEAGTLAAAGTVGFVLGDLSAVKARFGVPDAAIHVLGLGEPITVAVEAIGTATFAGHVTSIAPTADPQSRVFNVEVTIPNGDGRLRPGMIGTVTLSESARARAASASGFPTVPLTAVVRAAPGSGEFAVLVVERQASRDVARVRKVELGEVAGNAIAVRAGLTPGERIVVSGASLLTDGEPVRVLQ